ncbi:MAG: DUF1003 domain-containing protein [Myxacorys californica WJT36-NPBG1]|jgi:uncharacterized membrane protein|nr:DUF1003 domain-containing protein [Myxacorys californica WJT36-NPBG1]
MNSTKQKTQCQTPSICENQLNLEQSDQKNESFGQRLADAMAARVGSWAFIGAQSVVLAGWIGANSLPGVPHWDESPFILLNLVFSFASAYTAPVVLMSQNRQSDEDRKSAAINHKINLKADQSIELLHQKMDDLQLALRSTSQESRQISELMDVLKQQQAAHAAPMVHVPSRSYLTSEANLSVEPTESLRDDRKPKEPSVMLVPSVLNSQYLTEISSLADSHLQTKHKFSIAMSDEQSTNSVQVNETRTEQQGE